MARENYGPYTEGFVKIEYDNLTALENALKSNPHVAGFLVEPIQGEAGVYVPSEGYLKEAKSLCEKYDVLFIADEVQTGIARTGKKDSKSLGSMSLVDAETMEQTLESGGIQGDKF